MKTPVKIIAGTATTLLLAGAVSANAIASDDSSESHENVSTSSQTPSAPAQTSKARAKISSQQAEKTAVAKLPGFTVTKTHFDVEDGIPTWEVDLRNSKNPRQDADVDINANTGAVIKVDRDTGRDDSNDRDDD